jgi:ABC-type multidrug transport system fused ATPase/permease subunit
MPAPNGDPEPPASLRSSIRSVARGRARPIAGLAITAVLSGIAEAGILAVVAQVGTALVYGDRHVEVALGPVDLRPGVATLLILAAVLSVARIGLLNANARLQSHLAADVQMDLRKELFGAFTEASWGLQSREREGHLQEMLTSQVLQSTAGTLQFAALVSALITFVVLVLSAMLLNVLAAVVVVIVAVILFALLRPLSARGKRSAKALSEAQLRFAGGVGEAVRMAEETHVFGVEDAQQVRIAEMVDRAGGLFFTTQYINRLVPTLFQSLVYLTVIAGLGALFATGAGDMGALGAVILIMVRAASYGQQVQSSYQTILQSLPFAERLQAETSRYLAQRVGSPERRLGRIDSLELDAVSFGYRAERPVLSEVSFAAGRGDSVGIVGPSGAGKSTIVQILLRLRDPDGGEYLVNGAPARGFSFQDWHHQVAYVPQKPQLLHATVSENIRYFREIDEAAVRRAAELARIDEDIRGWSHGYETVIGPRADSISGGQQQRICLARALAADPDVLVLDEPTSALDPRSEALIQDSLRTIAAELTLFVVTHRMGLLDVCDRLLVLVDGRVEGFGDAADLRAESAYLGAA